MARQQLQGDVMTAPHFLSTRTVSTVSVPRLSLSRLSGLRSALASVVARVGDRVHSDGDAFAEAEGWQITRTRWGGRSYRHPGFVQRQEGQS